MIGEASVVLKVNIYKDIADYTNYKDSYNCDQDVQFAYENFTDETMPALFAFIYDEKIEKINYSEIERRLNLGSSNPPPQIDGNMVSRRKRGSGVCSVQPLYVNTTTPFFRFLIEQAAGTSNFEVLFPIVHNVGTCGGICDSRIPTGSPSNHAPMLDLLIKDGTLYPGDFTQYCVPVKYRSLQVWVDHPSIAIVTIDDIIVDRCECLDVLKH